MRAVPRLCGFYPGICLTIEEKTRKTLSQGSRRMPAGTMKTEQTECSETSAHKIQTPGNNPEESIQHSEHGESLKQG